MEAYNTAFTTWKSAQVRLEQILQEYLDVSVALKDLLGGQASSTSFREAREQMLMELNLELQCSSSRMQKIQRAEMCLRLARNSCRTLSPISLLPPDVLHTILSIAVRSKAETYSRRAVRTLSAPITSLSSVCFIWRRIMLHSPGFWTSPELVLEGTASEPCYELTSLWAERSRDLPLHLFVSGIRNFSRSRDDSHNWNIAEVGRLMVNLMPRVCTLHIAAGNQLCDRTVYSILNCWVIHGTASQAAWLDIGYNRQFTLRQGLGAALASQDTNVDADASVEFFRSLRSLTVYETSGGSLNFLPAGLVELRIHHPAGWFPTSGELCRTLTAVPQLRLLALSDIRMVRGEDPPDIVALNHLQTLILIGKDLWPVLGFITSTSERLEMNLSVSGSPTCASTVEAFLAGRTVTRLHLNGTGTVHAFDFIYIALKNMPQLHALALERFDISPFDFMDTTRPCNWPALQEIHLIDCNIVHSALVHLAAMNPFHILFWCRRHGDVYVNYSQFPNTDIQAAVEEIASKYDLKVGWVSEGADLPVDFWECAL